MQHAERRIRKLTLSGGDHSQLLQARYVVEEAFRTASLPGIPPNAAVLIRRLELGELRSSLPAHRVAEKITALVRDLAMAAVCVDEHPAPEAKVVWFSDPLRPYVTLLHCLLDDRPMNQWYWRSLFPDRAQVLNSASVEWLLTAARQTPLQALAPARLLQAVMTARHWSQLAPLITPVLAQRLLHEAGVSPAAVSTRARRRVALIPAPPVDADCRKALQYAADHWGAQDVRSRWLAWNILIAHQPAWLERKDSFQHIDVVEWLADYSCVRGEFGAGESPTGEIPPGPLCPIFGYPLGKGGMSVRDGRRALRDGDYAVAESRQKHRLVSQSAEEVDYSSDPQTPPPSSPPLQRGARGDLPTANQAPPSDNSTPPASQEQTATPAHLPLFSHHAGFAFVIPLLQRLGIAELLQRNEQLIELDFPRHLLWAMAQRFDMAADDPQWDLFASFEPYSDAALAPLQCPPLWSRLAVRSASARSLRELINTTQLRVGVYLRRYCKLSLRGLIRRRGHVAITTTHWDVLFDINQTDLRLRRVALDSDPGWVPWLGKVVQFHYDSEG